MIYKEDVELQEILSNIQKFINQGYDLEFSIDYNKELKDLPDNKLYTPNETMNFDYIEFISRIYNHFRSIERQQLYEFQVRFEYDENKTNLHYELCALRPFLGDAGYKRGGGFGTFSMRIFLTNRNKLLEDLYSLDLPECYLKLGINFIKEKHPFYLESIDNITEYLKSYLYDNCINQPVDNNYYDLGQRRMTFDQLKKTIINNININGLNVNDFELNIKECYDDFVFEINNKYLGNIVTLTQIKEVHIDYYLDIKIN